MSRNRALCCALLMLCSTALVAADKPAAKKPPPGRSETLACRLGTEDRHARIAVVVIRGKTDSFAYYSKWKPRTCSIYVQRHRDSHSKWADNGHITTVNLERGAFLIEHKPGEYHFIFRDIDRERYCGMDGVINGSLIIRRGSDQCQLEGDIMVEGVPLGQAHAKIEEEPREPVAPALDTALAPAQQPAAPVTTPAQQSAEPPPPPTTQPETPTGSRAPAEVAQKPTVAPPPAAGPTQKAAGTESSNPFRAFFRSITQQPPSEQQPQ